MRRLCDSYFVSFVLAQPSAVMVAVALLAVQRGHTLAALVLVASATPMIALLRVRG